MTYKAGSLRATHTNVIPDGNDEIRAEIPAVVEIIARTARWVNPEAFRQLPVWAPWTARGRALYDVTWTKRYTNTRRATGLTFEKSEGNVAAGEALILALGVTRPKPKNWTVCHIWGYDDPAFIAQGSIVQNPRYFSCIANMVWLPTPLKGFTDALPEIKRMLRTCAFHLYGWTCEDQLVKSEANAIRQGHVPDGYPLSWPTAERNVPPPGMAPFTPAVQREIDKRKQKMREFLAGDTLTQFPRDEMREVLTFWNVHL